LECTTESRLSAASRRIVTPVFHYNSITAADEKIPLSMVHVNKKPQYLVFCLHFPHQPSKYSHLPVESSKWPCGTRISAFKNLPQI
jgi:hypothetical protein